MEVLFNFLAERYERRSVMITSNLVFSQWDQIFKDAMTTAAAIDRLVHHAIILELTGRSYRGDAAEKRNRPQQGPRQQERWRPRTAGPNMKHSSAVDPEFQGSQRPCRASRSSILQRSCGVDSRLASPYSVACATSGSEKGSDTSLNRGAAPDPGIFQGIALAFDDSKQQCPGPIRKNRGINGASSTRHRSGYPLSGCVPAAPDSVSPDELTLCTTKNLQTRLGGTQQTTDGEV